MKCLVGNRHSLGAQKIQTPVTWAREHAHGPAYAHRQARGPHLLVVLRFRTVSLVPPPQASFLEEGKRRSVERQFSRPPSRVHCQRPS